MAKKAPIEFWRRDDRDTQDPRIPRRKITVIERVKVVRARTGEVPREIVEGIVTIDWQMRGYRFGMTYSGPLDSKGKTFVGRDWRQRLEATAKNALMDVLHNTKNDGLPWRAAKGESKEAKDAAELLLMLSYVDKMGREMKARLREKFAEGYRGGLLPKNRGMLGDMLYTKASRLPERLTKGARKQCVDIANLAMMLWGMERKV